MGLVVNILCTVLFAFYVSALAIIGCYGLIGDLYFLPLVVTFIASALSQLILLLGILKRISHILTSWLVYSLFEIAVAVTTFIYVAMPSTPVSTKFIDYFSPYLVVKFYHVISIYYLRIRILEEDVAYQELE